MSGLKRCSVSCDAFGFPGMYSLCSASFPPGFLTLCIASSRRIAIASSAGTTSARCRHLKSVSAVFPDGGRCHRLPKEAAVME